ncbi:hypothetical protein LCGC14_2357560, partial [marine sediment metagenome]
MSDEYAVYLKSPKWIALRKRAAARAKNLCEFCGRQGEAIHHVFYPRVLKDDHLDNLIVVCKSCHELSHGIRRSAGQQQGIKTIMSCVI